MRILASGVPLALQKGATYRVHGYLQSREYAETLGDYIKGANGLTSMLSASDDARREITHNRVTTEVVAEKLILVEKPTASARAASRRGPADMAPAEDNGAGPRTPARNGNGTKSVAPSSQAAQPEGGE